MALIMVAVIIAATNPEVLVCARHCLRKYSYLIIFWGGLYSEACGILVPPTGIEPAPLTLEAQSLNHWTTRKVPFLHYFI